MDKIVLFTDKKDCCACGACVNICPKDAISMKEDEFGFLYPEIDHEKCIQCRSCLKVCAYQHQEVSNTIKDAYVALAKEKEISQKSASGGIFAAVAKEILNGGGVVFGCSFEQQSGIICAEHIMIERVEDLEKLQGSKYVQSFIGTAYQRVKQELEKGRLVLFSGTPCQIAALGSFLGKVEFQNLLTIDIICHGVPGAKFFESYIKEFEKNLGGKIIAFKFRDKTGGWGLKGSVEYINKRGIHKKKIVPVQLSSYYQLFLDSVIYRENCYSCKYAGPFRTGDITIGDYWGVEKEHPEYLLVNGGSMDQRENLSCVLVNTERGKKMLEKFGFSIQLQPSTFEKVARQNGQLRHPSHRSDKRAFILKTYKEGGYAAVDKWHYKRLGAKRYIYMLWNALPIRLRAFIKRVD